MAFTVTIDVAAAAVPEAVKVPRNDRPELPEALNVAFTPLGRPEAETAMFDAEPLVTVTETAVTPADPPCTRLKLDGSSATEKTGPGAVTATVSERLAVMFPELPLTVNCVVLIAAELVALRVMVPGVLALAAVNDAVTPAGSPEAVSPTGPLKPFCGLTVMVAVPGLPAETLTLLAEGVRVKLGGGATVKASGAVAKMLPDFPVTMTVAAPSAAVALAVSVSVTPELDEPIAAVTPFGVPLAESATAPVKPFVGMIPTVTLRAVPCATVTLDGVRFKVMPGAPFTKTQGP